MITNQELNAIKLSPTKKDFYQIWNELLDVAGKISERWDPSSTNESDPGIVLLKVLTAVADKLNYNIDANTLEAFMPSAAQEESMRKLTEMMGYNMKYYRSATTEVKISYNNNNEEPIGGILSIDKFTNIKDIDDNINYITLDALNLTSSAPSGNVACMEGELVECETDDNNIVSMFHLDDNKRYFLPETQVAENGVFVTNILNNIEGTEWKQVYNLNAQSLGSKVFKFGFDSQEGLPYVQFPEDISTIIEDGLRIKYVRTSGADGNISVNTLTKLTTPMSWIGISSEDKTAYYDVANYSVSNIRAATNGANKEGINSAYNNFKKTVGTFDTLVTCRDYMNKIYQMLSSTDNTTPLVSNVIVSDIKDDINRSVTICTFTNRGIEYKIKAKPSTSLNNFDLMIYPFRSVYGLNSKSEFEKSFDYDNSNVSEILSNLEDNKTISHNIKSPESAELACIKNYYRLKAKVNTIRKVGIIEQTSILQNIYAKLFEKFNMRQLDFGEEIPYNYLLEVMETADSRIKNISLEDPELTTKFTSVDNVDYDLNSEAGKKYYNSLALRNVLAGRVPLFNYNTNFSTNFKEKNYSGNANFKNIYPNKNEPRGIYKLKTEFEVPIEAVEGTNILKLTENEVIQFRAPSFKTTVTYPAYVNYYLHLNKEDTEFIQAIPATMQSLRDFLRGGPNASDEIAKETIEHYINNTNFPTSLLIKLEISEELRKNANDFKNKFNEISNENCAIFINPTSDNFEYILNSEAALTKITEDPDVEFYTLVFDKSGTSTNGVSKWASWLVNLDTIYLDHTDDKYREEKTISLSDESRARIKGFYKIISSNLQSNVGQLVDSEGRKFKLVEATKDVADNPFDYYYVQRIWSSIETIDDESKRATAEAKDWHTIDSLGQNAVPFALSKGTEYRLKEKEYLLINYTQSKSDNSDQKEEIYKVYTTGAIIKPNFDLSDSEDWRASGHSFTKHNVKFEGYSNIISIFTLGTEQQIEIREIVQVTLDERNTNIYWELNNLTSIQGDYVEFPFDEEPINKNTGEPWKTADGESNKIYSAYTLKEGEYLYYTDMNKTDIAFYGFGSTIKRKHNTPIIYKYISENTVTSEDIADKGLSASIPWRNYNFEDNGSLTIIENQFVNLTNGDYLVDIQLSANEDPIINNDYKSVDFATYAFAISDNNTVVSEDNLSSSQLPPIQVKNYKWQVRSKLNLAVGPNKYQTLRIKDIINHDDKKVKDKLTLINTTTAGGIDTNHNIVTLQAANKNQPLSFKTNKIVQSATTFTDVTKKEFSEAGILEKRTADLQVKLFEIASVTNNKGKVLDIGNYGLGQFTTVSFEEQALQANIQNNAEQITIALNTLIPDDTFGLLMIYYKKLDSSNTKSAKVSCTVNNNIEFYNTTTSTAANELTLNEGINIIKINSSDVLTILSNFNNKSIITFGSLDLINNNEPINPKLKYKTIEENTIYTQILKDIRQIDNSTEFYYNVPIASNIDIDMNPNDEKDNLENPLNWFNYNNVNNKFVISVINTNYLSDDIVIARSSRSNF